MRSRPAASMVRSQFGAALSLGSLKTGERLISALQLQNCHIGVANPHAQFAPQGRQELDRNIRLLLTKHGKRRLAQAETCEVFVSRNGGRARPAVQNREFSKDRAGCKGHEPDIPVIVLKMNARAAFGDKIK